MPIWLCWTRTRACEVDKLKDIKVVLTIVNGRIVYERASPPHMSK